MTTKEALRETFAGDPERLRTFIELTKQFFRTEEALQVALEVLAELEAEAEAEAAAAK